MTGDRGMAPKRQILNDCHILKRRGERSRQCRAPSSRRFGSSAGTPIDYVCLTYPRFVSSKGQAICSLPFPLALALRMGPYGMECINNTLCSIVG